MTEDPVLHFILPCGEERANLGELDRSNASNREDDDESADDLDDGGGDTNDALHHGSAGGEHAEEKRDEDRGDWVELCDERDRDAVEAEARAEAVGKAERCPAKELDRAAEAGDGARDDEGQEHQALHGEAVDL